MLRCTKNNADNDRQSTSDSDSLLSIKIVSLEFGANIFRTSWISFFTVTDGSSSSAKRH